mgnify:CR=1 FL=1
MYDNPLLSFYRGRAAPGFNVAGTFLEATTKGAANFIPYEKIDSVPDIFTHLGKSSLPFVVQTNLEGSTVLDDIVSEAGLRTNPVPPTPEERRRQRFEPRRENLRKRLEQSRGNVPVPTPTPPARPGLRQRLQEPQAVPAGAR